jgi:hypothetical protein
MLRGLGAGLLGGLGWGVVARLFMRLLTDEPHFSWEGTLGILGIATVAGACVGLVHAARVSGRSGWWRLAVLPALLLFAGPGSLLLPAALGMAVVLRARAALRPLGVLLVVVTPVVAVTMPPTAPTPTQVVGLAVLLLSAVPMGWGIGEVARRWQHRPVAAGEPARQPAGGPTPAPAVA